MKSCVIFLAVGVALTSLSIGGAHPARAGPEVEAWSALERGEYDTAYKLLKPLAEGGAAWAQVNLGLMFAQGQGVDQDYDEALKWFREAARQSDVTAQSCIGKMYEEGHGISIDYAKAAHWYRKAADQGLVWAQTHIGQMYSRGQGLPQDPVQALMWFQLAADAGDLVAEQLRGTVASCLSPEQISEAEELARRWKAQHER